MPTQTFFLSSAKVEGSRNPPRNEGRKEQPNQEDTEAGKQTGLRWVPGLNSRCHSTFTGPWLLHPGASWPRTTTFRSEATPPLAQPPPGTGERWGPVQPGSCSSTHHLLPPSGRRAYPLRLSPSPTAFCHHSTRTGPCLHLGGSLAAPKPRLGAFSAFPTSHDAGSGASFTPELGAPKRKTPQETPLAGSLLADQT